MNLSWQSFVLHVFNIAVLYVLLRYLLYKPVSDFMRKRQEKYEEERNAISDREKIVTEREAEAERIVHDAKEIAVRETREEVRAAERKAQLVMEDAQKKADEYMVKAKAQAEEDKRIAEEEMRVEAANLAVRIAGKLVERDFSDEDNRAFVDKCINGGDGE